MTLLADPLFTTQNENEGIGGGGVGRDCVCRIKARTKILRVLLLICFLSLLRCSWLQMTLEQSSCATTLIQRNAQVCFNTNHHPFFMCVCGGGVFYRLASCMHVIDCSR